MTSDRFVRDSAERFARSGAPLGDMASAALLVSAVESGCRLAPDARERVSERIWGPGALPASIEIDPCVMPDPCLLSASREAIFERFWSNIAGKRLEQMLADSRMLSARPECVSAI